MSVEVPREFQFTRHINIARIIIVLNLKYRHQEILYMGPICENIVFFLNLSIL